ncbi:MAG TPA: hypothetical protein VIK85_04310 [Coriobacteriia bacterium]
MSATSQGSHDDWRARRHGGETASWVVGVILILLGVAFMLERAGIFVLTGNWWSVFIYLAAAACFVNAWRSYRAKGEVRTAAGGSLTWGLVLTAIATIFLLDLEWNMWWPALLIALGVGMVLSSWLRNMTGKSEGGTQ